MLGLVVTLVLIRAIFPAGKSSQGERLAGKLDRALVATPTVPMVAAAAGRRIIASEDARDEGRRMGRRLRPAFIDEILANAESQGWGTARVLRILEGRTVVRYYDCTDCRVRTPGLTTASECGFQAGYLEAAFARLHDGAVHVRELACRRLGDTGCEFEVVG